MTKMSTGFVFGHLHVAAFRYFLVLLKQKLKLKMDPTVHHVFVIVLIDCRNLCELQLMINTRIVNIQHEICANSYEQLTNSEHHK